MKSKFAAFAGTVRRIVGFFRCKHIWLDRIYTHGDWTYSRCIGCGKKRREKWTHQKHT